MVAGVGGCVKDVVQAGELYLSTQDLTFVLTLEERQLGRQLRHLCRRIPHNVNIGLRSYSGLPQPIEALRICHLGDGPGRRCNAAARPQTERKREVRP